MTLNVTPENYPSVTNCVGNCFILLEYNKNGHKNTKAGFVFIQLTIQKKGKQQEGNMTGFLEGSVGGNLPETDLDDFQILTKHT